MIDWSEVFYYDLTSPSGIRWNKNIVIPNTLHGSTVYKRRKGDIAGCYNKRENRYAVKYQQKLYRVHRIIYELHYGKIEENLVIDHIDGDASNNDISNLRMCTLSVNSQNTKKRSSNKTGVNGVILSDVYRSENDMTYSYFAATWQENRITKYKYFSINKLGKEKAFCLACEYRSRMIAQLNEQGADYTERHGT